MLISNHKKIEYLKKLIETNKLPHALLVSGISTKEFVQRLFGQSIAKIHPDFILVEPEGQEIKIAQVRDCLWRLSLKPSIISMKVAFVDKAHLMNREAQSALLKTLEEPKGNTFLVLVTDHPDLLFPTILSRVQRIKFFSGIKETRENHSDIARLAKSDLAVRFQYAEKISKDPQLKEILTNWLRYFRNDVVKNKLILQKLQNTIFLISRTNINPRLALETLMLELEKNDR